MWSPRQVIHLPPVWANIGFHPKDTGNEFARVSRQRSNNNNNNNNNNNTNSNNNNITYIAVKSSGARAQKRNKTKSLIIFKSRGHTGAIISLRG